MVARARRDDHQGMLNDFAQRLRVWWLREELDERLANGANPDTDPLLTRRAAQLTTRSTRTSLADGLESALAEARKPWTMSARLPLRRAEIRACADDIVALAARLRDDEPIDVAGAAMAASLVFDGTGPIYHDGAVPLRYAVRSARMALDPLGSVVDADLSRVT
jgi:hypothetical protein